MSINVDYKGVEVGNLAAISGGTYTFVAGRAVYADAASGKLAWPLASKRVLGLIKESQISGVVNEISGQYGIYGSSNASVLLHGVATVRQSVYNGVSYAVYDETQTYVVGDDIYATPATGVLTNQNITGMGPNGITSVRVGRVLSKPVNPANGDPMTITVECA